MTPSFESWNGYPASSTAHALSTQQKEQRRESCVLDKSSTLRKRHR